MRLVAVAIVMLLASSVRAGEPAAPSAEPIRIRADRVTYDSRNRVFEASGGVEVRQGERLIRADELAFDDRSGRGTANGNVVIVDGPDTLRSSFVDLDLYTFTGVVLDGSFRSEATGLHASGAIIEKTGGDNYRFEEGRFTTCDCEEGEREPWAIRADEAEFETEGYGTARNARVEVLGVPVAWIPWMLYPVQTKRQSGLLLPEFGISGRNGIELGLPVFLAVGDPLNVTLTPRWLSKRGFKGDAELEYVVGERSEGNVFGSYLYDQEIKAHSESEPFSRRRWVAKGEQDFFLPLASRAKADFQFVSDNQYPTDFEGLGQARRDRYLESTGFLARGFGASRVLGLVGSSDYADDMQNPDDEDRDDFVLQRLPQVDAELLPAGAPLLSRLVPTLGVHYTWFQQLGSAQGKRPTGIVVGKNQFLDTGIDSLPDAQERGPEGGPEGPPPPDPNDDNFPTAKRGTENDGLFEEGEPIADHGQRVLLTPRLGAPLRLFDLFELYPEVGWHQTLYGSNAQGFEQRGLLIGRADLRTRLRRRFGSLVHVLEPRVGWAFVSDQRQRDKPFYVPRTAVPQRRLRQLDLQNVVLDSADRISDVNAVTLGLGNRLYAPGAEGGAPRLVADFLLSGEYESTSNDFGVVYLDGRAYPWERADTWFILGFDPEKGRIDEGLLNLAWRFKGGHRIAFGYRYSRRVGRYYEDFKFARKRFKKFQGEFNRINQISTRIRLAITERWALTYRGGLSFEESVLLANRGGIEYFSRCGCWSAGIEVAQDEVRGVSIGVTYSLSGLGKDALSQAAARHRSEGASFLDAF